MPIAYPEYINITKHIAMLQTANFIRRFTCLQRPTIDSRYRRQNTQIRAISDRGGNLKIVPIL